MFKRMIADEQYRTASGNFVEAHIYLPHVPYALDENGVYFPEGTTYEAQALYSLKLLSEFIDELKRLSRYENSSIIVHGDHGYKLPPDEFTSRLSAEAKQAIDKAKKRRYLPAEEIEMFAHALLLFKAPQQVQDELVVSERETQLVDIPATIYDLAGLSVKTEEGMSIRREDFPTGREIHVFEGYAQGEQHSTQKIIHQIPGATYNDFSFTKGIGWKVHPELLTVEPAALSAEAVVKLGTKAGMSRPKARNGMALVAPETDLGMNGWYVSGVRQEVTAIVNGKIYEAKYEIRSDVEEDYPEYPIRSGWRFTIPTADLLPTNNVQILLGGKQKWAFSVEVGSNVTER
jgi:hypothetical protein